MRSARSSKPIAVSRFPHPASPRALVVPLVACLLAFAAPAFAAWPHDALTNIPVCTDAAAQTLVRSVPDGFGNTMIAWRDLRQGGAVVYAQRLRPDGSACWMAGGVPVCASVTYATDPVLVADGHGGAIVVWEDGRPGNQFDVYAQRIDSTGARLWNGNGVALSTADWTQHYLAITSDGAGGAIVAWSDERFGLAEDVYAQRVDATGTTRWAANGLLVCNVTTYKFPPAIAPDGAGGAYVMWSDCRVSNAKYDAYVQRISSAGAIQWTANGVRAMPGLLDQAGAAIVPDATGGCIVASYGSRTVPYAYEVGIQRFTGTGTLRWGNSGITLAGGSGYRQQIRAIADGRGGAIVAWMIDAVDAGDLCAARADSNGVASWSAGGVALCTASQQQWNAVLASDGAGGAVVAWEDLRNGADADIRAQRVSAAGSTMWMANGVALCTASGDQVTPCVTPDGAGGLTCAWQDMRAGNWDAYAQWVDAGGRPGGPVTGVGPVERPDGLALAPPAPNPSRGMATARFTLPRAAHVRLSLVDAAGRTVRVLLDGACGSGERQVAVPLRDAGGRAVPAGLYFLQLEAGGGTLTRKLVALE